MPQDNVEAVRKAFEYWNRGDLDAASELWDDDVVLRAAQGWLERVLSEKDEVRSFYDGFAQGHDTVLEDLVDAGGSVVTRIRAHVSGHESGIEGDLRTTQATTGRKGKAVLIEYFWDHQEAVEAAGLRE